jgi:hypothetical protein
MDPRKENIMRYCGWVIGLLVLGACSGFVLGAAAVDLSGVWEMTLQTPQGEQTVEATVTQDKESLKVTMIGPQGMEMKGEGTVKENDVEWTMVVSAQMGEFVLAFKGKVDGETMSGEVQMGDFGSAPWSAKKKK